MSGEENSGRSSTLVHGSATPSAAEGVDVLPPGAVVEDYEIESLRARGGFGQVYTAKHRTQNQRVAIKVLHSALGASQPSRLRFIREAQSIQRIGHPHIVDSYAIGTLPDGRLYHVMELLQGTELHRLIAEHGRLGMDDILALFRPLCEALGAAHAHEIVHRDVKASNVIVGPGPGIEWIKLLDFGLAKLLASQASGQNISGERIVGTLHSLSPEQICEEPIDARTDIYALGVLLFHVATGRQPFEGDPISVLEQHLYLDPERPSRFAPVNKAVDDVVLRAMAKQPDQRFPSARDFWEALQQAASGAPSAPAERS